MARYLEEPKNEPSTFEQRVPPLSSIMIVKEDSFETVPLEDETTASNIMIVKEDPFETALLEDETITKYILEKQIIDWISSIFFIQVIFGI